MVNYPNLTVLIVTFARPKAICTTLYSFLKHQNYPLEKLHFHLADNDSEKRANIKDYVPTILKEFDYLNWTCTIEKRAGWGYNVNTALKKIKNKFIYFTEDDYSAYAKINLTDGVVLLDTKSDVGMIRYDGIAGHVTLALNLCECKTKTHKFTYLTIDNKHSVRPIAYSNRPHLMHKRLTDYYGLYSEGLTLGHTERAYALKIRQNWQGPKIAVLQDGIQNRFRHLGAGKESRQGSKFDKGK